MADHGMVMGSGMPRTFADLVAARTGKPLDSGQRTSSLTRKNEASLSQDERTRFLDALEALNLPDATNISAYGRLVAIHSDMGHRMHDMGDGSADSLVGQQRFLPWHRVYLHQFEAALQSVDPSVTVPYWDWSDPQHQAVPDWLVGVRPTVNIPRPGPGRLTVTRFPGTRGFSLADAISGNVDPAIPSLASVQKETDFTAFSVGLEDIHNLVHVWVGGRKGTMALLDRAPADPIFWMHHANIDRLWWEWHGTAQGQGQNPTLTGADAILDPWPNTEADTRDIAGFNYDYG